VINLGQEKAARRRVGKVLAEDELDVEAAFDVGGVLYEGGREGGREVGQRAANGFVQARHHR
jgi:predicted hydrocarbon binding protein